MTNDATRKRLNQLAKQLEPLAHQAYTLTLLWYAVKCFQEGYDSNPDIVQIADRSIHRLADFIDAHFKVLSFDEGGIFADVFVLRSLSGRLKDVSAKPISMPSPLIPATDVRNLRENLCEIEEALNRAFESTNNLLRLTQLNELKEGAE
jgi:hypothetical protein